MRIEKVVISQLFPKNPPLDISILKTNETLQISELYLINCSSLVGPDGIHIQGSSPTLTKCCFSYVGSGKVSEIVLVERCDFITFDRNSLTNCTSDSYGNIALAESGRCNSSRSNISNSYSQCVVIFHRHIESVRSHEIDVNNCFVKGGVCYQAGNCAEAFLSDSVFSGNKALFFDENIHAVVRSYGTAMNVSFIYFYDNYGKVLSYDANNASLLFMNIYSDTNDSPKYMPLPDEIPVRMYVRCERMTRSENPKIFRFRLKIIINFYLLYQLFNTSGVARYFVLGILICYL